MNEKIKEILDNFEKYEARYKLHNETQFIITHREIEPLLDYITNLQQENEKLNRMCELYSKSLYNAELTDYKSRCEGTINLIDRTIEIIKQQPTKDDSWILSRLYGFKYALNGSDEK